MTIVDLAEMMVHVAAPTVWLSPTFMEVPEVPSCLKMHEPPTFPVPVTTIESVVDVSSMYR